MADLNALSSTIMTEADDILYKLGLLKILGKYGEVFIAGSYFLNLMTWRDLDFNLDNSKVSSEDFFKLGYEISNILQPYKMSYRNEEIGKTVGLPQGLYWGVYTNTINPDTWKIDIWGMSSDQFINSIKQAELLKAKIGSLERLTILEIKNYVCKHPLYRKEFCSIDIYKSVLEYNVQSIEGFSRWLSDYKGIVLYR